MITEGISKRPLLRTMVLAGMAVMGSYFSGANLHAKEEPKKEVYQAPEILLNEKPSVVNLTPASVYFGNTPRATQPAQAADIKFSDELPPTLRGDLEKLLVEDKTPPLNPQKETPQYITEVVNKIFDSHCANHTNLVFIKNDSYGIWPYGMFLDQNNTVVRYKDVESILSECKSIRYTSFSPTESDKFTQSIAGKLKIFASSKSLNFILLTAENPNLCAKSVNLASTTSQGQKLINMCRYFPIAINDNHLLKIGGDMKYNAKFDEPDGWEVVPTSANLKMHTPKGLNHFFCVGYATPPLGSNGALQINPFFDPTMSNGRTLFVPAMLLTSTKFYGSPVFDSKGAFFGLVGEGQQIGKVERQPAKKVERQPAKKVEEETGNNYCGVTSPATLRYFLKLCHAEAVRREKLKPVPKN